MIEVAIGLELITCGAEGCGITFAAPQRWVDERRRDHASWWCPNGHKRYWLQKSEEEKLREALATAQGNLNYYKERTNSLSSTVTALERSRAAFKGQTTKLRKRAANGVCGWCHRHFANVERHVRSQHPHADEESDLDG